MDQLQVETQKYKNVGEQAGITREFHFEELKIATNNFDEANLIGRGGYATVFKGILKDDKTEVAVKRMDNKKRVDDQFKNEILAVASVRHINLVCLRGYCVTSTTFYIVYDLLPNGSLDKCNSRDASQGLSWKLRYNVAVDVANALVFLHHYCKEPRLHLDIKPGNILLDKNFRAVLSDFGMSKLLKNGERTVFTGRRGTRGYIAPEWDDGVSTKCDIFSYGKVLMDLFFGQCYVCLNENGKDIYSSFSVNGNYRSEEQIFHDFMQNELNRGEVMKHIDKRLLNNANEKEVTCLVRAALLCIQCNPDKRPSDMKQVIGILEGKDNSGSGKRKRHLCFEPFLTEQLRSPIPVPPCIPEHFDTMASREPTKEEVIQAFMDEKINLVGIYGMGGVGKTTLVKQIREEVEKRKLFDKVVLATVSQKPNLKWIQTQIAENLHIKLKEKTLEARARRLSLELKRVKHILIILDDAWERLNLVNLGIVLGRIGENICKVLISSRILDVCLSMGSKNNIKVNILADDESLELFRCEVGDADYNAKRKMSKEIVKECKGLPLAIITLARSLIGKDEGVWGAVVPQLNKSMYDDMDPVNASIKLSYDFLNINTRLCFLLCSLFPEDHLITLDSLIGYALGEGLLGDGETLREAKENLHVMVDRLVSSGLLLKSYKNDSKPVVMMHDIIRDTAVTIARDNSIIKARLGLKKCPEVAINCIRMSLMDNDICAVPNAPRTSQLVTLSLARNKSLESFPDGFFEGLKCLATLDLSETGIALLPQSILSLENCLRSLYLDECGKLQNLCGIGNLKALEILSVRCTQVHGVRMLGLGELKGLTNLKMLNLVGCSSLVNIPANVLSSLSSLEELYTLHNVTITGRMRIVNISRWERVRMRNENNGNLVELTTLANLTSLDVQFHKSKFLSTDMGTSFWKKLTKFNIVQHGPDESRPHFNDERLLMLNTRADSFPLADWVMVLLEKTYNLDIYLNGCEGIKNILHLNPNGFYDLKSLYLDSADSMEYIVDASNYVPKRLFNQLQNLQINDLGRLKAIWNGPIHENSFNKLEYLEIIGCGKLVNILPFRFGTNLQNLEENAQRFHQAEVFHVQECNSSFYLGPSTNNGANNFASCNSSGLPQPPIFSNLQDITIEGCNGLKCIFSVGMLQSLAQLRSLMLSYCDEMEGITEDCQVENEGEYVNNKVLLPHLHRLRFMNLPRFSSFFLQQRRWWLPHVCLECPSLVTIQIWQCPNLNRLPFGLQSIPELQTFETDDFKWFEQLQCEDPSIKLQMKQVYQQVVPPSGRSWSPKTYEEQLEQLEPLQNYFPLEKYSYL